MSNKPDLTKFSKTLFWDTTIDRTDFVTHKCYVINRVFERGNEEEIMEIIRFYGRDTILNNLNRNGNPLLKPQFKANIEKYLGCKR
ncbi:MAG: hypothetical protein IKU88_05025 [Alistipes sp.]|nr:hypothetical protein [Alistipes sp.]